MRLILINIILNLSLSANAQIKGVHATVETPPLSGSWAGDDGAIWVHPTNPDSSCFVGVDKSNDGRVELYNLDGSLHYHSTTGQWTNNVDVRYNVALGGNRVDIVCASVTTCGCLQMFTLDPNTRTLVDVTGNTNVGFSAIYGMSLYQDKCADKLYAYVTPKPADGSVYQFELADNGTGQFDANLVRTMSLNTLCEGLVIDDVHHIAYIAEEDNALWSVGAKATDPTTLTKIDSVSGPNLDVDIEGLTLYYSNDSSGYLIACSQYSNYYSVYDRITNAFIGKFSIVQGVIDDCYYPDGIDVMSYGLGSAFPNGAFLSHDYANDNNQNPNYKIVPWESIADSLGLDISPFNPRNLGSTSSLTIQEECFSDSVLLYTTDLMDTYNWSNGMAGDSIYVMDTGYISLTGLSSCGGAVNSNMIYIDSFPCDTASIVDTSVTDTTIVTNISGNSSLNLKIYPNPFNNQFILDMVAVDEVMLSVFDISGKLVDQFLIEEQLSVINTSKFKKGIYFIEVRSGSEKKILKLIKN